MPRKIMRAQSCVASTRSEYSRAMGAYDEIAAAAPCPRCARLHHVYAQSKFFEPDFGDVCMRRFEPGLAHPSADSVTSIVGADVWAGNWYRVGENFLGDTFCVLDDFFHAFRCDCGIALLAAFRFRMSSTEPSQDMLTSGPLRQVQSDAGRFEATVMLVDIELCDLQAPDSTRTVDFASCYYATPGAPQPSDQETQNWAAHSPAERVHLVRRAFKTLFETYFAR